MDGGPGDRGRLSRASRKDSAVQTASVRPLTFSGRPTISIQYRLSPTAIRSTLTSPLI